MLDLCLEPNPAEPSLMGRHRMAPGNALRAPARPGGQSRTPVISPRTKNAETNPNAPSPAERRRSAARKTAGVSWPFGGDILAPQRTPLLILLCGGKFDAQILAQR